MGKTITIAYYISDYGYGHVSRSVAIIRELLERTKRIKIIVCNSFAIDFLQQSLTDSRVSFRNVQTDTGFVLEKGSIQPDAEGTSAKLQEFINNYPNIYKHETSFLINEKVDLLVSDISPIAFESSNKLSIPTIAISNFTWFSAYEGLVKEEQLKWLEEEYQLVDYFFHLGASMERAWGRYGNDTFSFFSRKTNKEEVVKVQGQLPDEYTYKIFIGIGMKIGNLELSSLPIWDSPQCLFIVSSNMHIDKTNVISIPKDYVESQNYMAVCDLIISKPGWGTVGEAIQLGKPLLLLNRNGMSEDQTTIQYLKEVRKITTINWEGFSALTLDGNYIQSLKEEQTTEGSTSCLEEIAKSILAKVDL